MLILQKYWWWIVGLVALIISGLGRVDSSILPSTAQMYCQQNSDAGTQFCAAYKVIGFWIAGLASYGGAIEAAITAIATAFIAYFTYTLKEATARLWDAGERQLELATKTAERQLRAYVYVESVEMTPPDLAGPSKAHLTIKNVGQTPGYGVVHLGRMLIQDFPSLIPLPELDEAGPTSRSDVPPSGILIKTLAGKRPLTLDERARITNGTAALYVYGEIRYRDAFGQDRWTRYRLMRGGNVGVSPTTMTTTEEGNESN